MAPQHRALAGDLSGLPCRVSEVSPWLATRQLDPHTPLCALLTQGPAGEEGTQFLHTIDVPVSSVLFVSLYFCGFLTWPCWWSHMSLDTWPLGPPHGKAAAAGLQLAEACLL